VLCFGLFCYFSIFFPVAPLPWKRLISVIFRSFLLFFNLFFPLPPSPGKGLLVLFFGLFCYFSVIFSVPLLPGNFLPTPLVAYAGILKGEAKKRKVENPTRRSGGRAHGSHRGVKKGPQPLKKICNFEVKI